MTPMEAVNEALSLIGQPEFADVTRHEEQLGESLAIIYGDRWQSAYQAGADFVAADPRAADLLLATGLKHHPMVALHIIDVAMRASASQ